MSRNTKKDLSTQPPDYLQISLGKLLLSVADIHVKIASPSANNSSSVLIE